MKPYLLLFIGMALFPGTGKVLAMGEVALLNARSFQCPPVSGCFVSTSLSGVVEVKNLGFHKKVKVVWTDLDGEKGETDGIFLSQSGTGKELWSFSVQGVAVEYFAVSLSVNDKTWVDDNWGRFYFVEKHVKDAILTSPLIMKALPDPIEDKAGDYNEDKEVVTGDVLVRSIADSKEVAVTYTDDGWLSKKTTEATFAESYPSGVERWTFELEICSDCLVRNIQFAIRYKDSDLTSWDNNYSRNYWISAGKEITRNKGVVEQAQ